MRWFTRPDPADVDPHRFPWGAAVLLVVLLLVLMFVGNRVVEDVAGEGAAVAYQVVVAVVWLLVALAYMTRKGGGR